MLDRTQVKAGATVNVTTRVTNTGERAGADVVQLYASTPGADVTAQRPRNRLVAFKKVVLAPHQSAPVTFPVATADLAFFDEKSGTFRVDTGRYGLQLAASSADVRAQAFVSVTGELPPAPTVVTAKPVIAGDAARGVAQRVFIPAGRRIDPQLTVALADQSLYGFVTLGRSRPLPPGMAVRYESNRPSVVSAGPDGLRTVHAGVATVTATVSYRGSTARGTFVVACL
jgi:beta-glucosidase